MHLKLVKQDDDDDDDDYNNLIKDDDDDYDKPLELRKVLYGYEDKHSFVHFYTDPFCRKSFGSGGQRYELLE